ncbi:MAG: hypothetical protein KDH88_17870 [Chromatiales bacterium]|nr:hypothetical protein [Chromatiales bacterium]
MVVPPLIYLSSGALSLVSLRKGAGSGVTVLVGAGVAAVLLAVLLSNSPVPGIVFTLAVWAPALLVALALRASASAGIAVTSAVGLGLIVLITLTLLVGDPAKTWGEPIGKLLGPMLNNAGIDPGSEEAKAGLERLAALIHGVLAAGFAAGTLFGVFIGRWMQSLAYNPGGFQEEFHQLRLPRLLALAVIVALIGDVLLEGRAGDFSRDLTLILLTGFLFQGLAVVHGLVRLMNAHIAWLIGLYALMFVIPHQLSLLLALVGLADVWFDFRARKGPGAAPS